MNGDFSRSTYRPTNHYSSVRLQQGRVLLDAEWNEQADIVAHVDRTTTSDVVGPTGAPKSAPGDFANFAVRPDVNDTDLRIAPGRIYVDGLLCENHGDGVLYKHQPDFPDAWMPNDNGNFAVYLDVWERHITAVDQFGQAFPPLLESALQGPDTATRTRVVWQVNLRTIPALTCSAFVPPAAPTGKLRASELPPAGPAEDCLVPPGGGYRRLENQLYRVEVHAIVQGKPVVKWSRDDGSIASRVKSIDPAALTVVVEDGGRDDVLGFGAATWVELSDEERVLQGGAGALFEVAAGTNDTSIKITNPDALSLAIATNPTLRRWDGIATLDANTPLELESGVQIEIDGGTFAIGDYWLIPARTRTGKVEWPKDTANPPAPIFESRHGTLHHYCLLAVTSADGTGKFNSTSDCRHLFPPLTAITASDVSYDPAKCSNLAGTATVQQAIDILCQNTGSSDDDGIHIKDVSFISGDPLVNDTFVDPELLAQGIRITCDNELFQDSVRNLHGVPNPVCSVTIDLPWPTSGPEQEQWQVEAFGFVGFTTITLAAQVNADNNQIFWVPLDKPPTSTRNWLLKGFSAGLETRTHGQARNVLARLILKGNYIWGPKEPELYLDGDAFGTIADGHVDTRFPSGDGKRGGDFEMWFWLGRE
jgi:Family of unknown function (DUF6519)